MDGDPTPLKELTRLVNAKVSKERRCIIVDEAHAVGLYGLNGAGLVDELQVQESVHIRLATFGKAFGCSGAAVLCTSVIRQFLYNYSRPLIYSTAIPHPSLLSIHSALDLLATPNGTLRASNAFSLTRLLLTSLQPILLQYADQLVSLPVHLSQSPSHLPPSPIVPLLSSEPRALAKYLIECGYLVRPIVYPTVPKGSERVRICVHSHNTSEQVMGLVSSVQSWLMQRQGQYIVKPKM
jgi:8-amino-7-oxononanoate synthase